MASDWITTSEGARLGSYHVNHLRRLIRVVCETGGEVGMIVASVPGVQAERVPRQGVQPGTVAFDVTFPPSTPAGVVPIHAFRPPPAFGPPWQETQPARPSKRSWPRCAAGVKEPSAARNGFGGSGSDCT